MVSRAALLLALLLAGCWGVAGDPLFAASPLTPPGLCPETEDCNLAPAEGETWPPPDSTSPDAGDPEPVEVAHG